MESSSFQTKAIDFQKKAEKHQKGSFFGNFMRGKQDRNDEAKDLYLNAANCWKLAQQLDKAYECYMKCVECEEDEGDSAPHFREAANCMKEKDMDEYVRLTWKAIDLYSLNSRSSTGASMGKECAILLEESYDYEQSIKFY